MLLTAPGGTEGPHFPLLYAVSLHSVSVFRRLVFVFVIFGFVRQGRALSCGKMPFWAHDYDYRG